MTFLGSRFHIHDEPGPEFGVPLRIVPIRSVIENEYGKESDNGDFGNNITHRLTCMKISLENDTFLGSTADNSSSDPRREAVSQRSRHHISVSSGNTKSDSSENTEEVESRACIASGSHLTSRSVEVIEHRE